MHDFQTKYSLTNHGSPTARAFNTGLDFAGPFDFKSSPLRKSPLLKGYVCVFICFSTKAIHLEPCSELSTKAFQATFSRFVGRRGLPQRVFSDNGKNFVGASGAYRQDFKRFLKESSDDIRSQYSIHGFEWQFLPPNAPHMGGLWEAAVKSFKLHFKRIVGSNSFTFEELATLLARIEGMLNSRPLSPMSDNPQELLALTPGHFLRGAPLIAAPEPQIDNLSLQNRWEKLKLLHQQFSQRWKDEYLKELHQRYKWKISHHNLSVGDFVVIKNELLPPNEWRLGRVEKVYHGSDNKVRVADIRTQHGTLTRPIVKLCPLPSQTDLSHPLP
ncbi:uncharacterized protein LOC118750209 [Rhagoletis pomonella]|uniref:uncharacterized protein LOC118750209 n=1 Tax=Rhagoletis pomonella TaxID=28610 RepID=UPI0017802106|nr:uncharacterized protein LOC118750209 [Rhagoletis pomonella]